MEGKYRTEDKIEGRSESETAVKKKDALCVKVSESASQFSRGYKLNPNKVLRGTLWKNHDRLRNAFLNQSTFSVEIRGESIQAFSFYFLVAIHLGLFLLLRRLRLAQALRLVLRQTNAMSSIEKCIRLDQSSFLVSL